MNPGSAIYHQCEFREVAEALRASLLPSAKLGNVSVYLPPSVVLRIQQDDIGKC